MTTTAAPRPPSRAGTWLRANATWLFVVALVAQTFVMVAMVSASQAATDALDAQVDTETLGACERGNEGRVADNALNAAIAAVAAAVDLNRQAVDGSASALVAALTPPEGLDEEDAEAAAEFLGGTQALTEAVTRQLDVAGELLVIAVRDLRDCDRVLDDPDATIPQAPPTIVPPAGDVEGDG